MISAAELARIQADTAAAALDKSCVIQRATVPVKDGYGSETLPYVTIATVNAGMHQPNGTHLANYDYLIGSLATWEVKFAIGTDVQHQDHLVIEGQTLEVQVILTPRSYPALLTVLASEIK